MGANAVRVMVCTMVCTVAAVAGLARAGDAESPGARRVLAADYSTKRLAIVDDKSEVLWEYPVGDIHDLHMLPDGHVLFQTSMTHLLEVEPKTNKTVWEYDAGTMNGNAGRPVQVHAFQRLPGGLTMIAESGPARILEVDRGGNIVRQIKLKVDHPDPHRDTRLARKLENGHYLVCHEGDGTVREYDGGGKVVWEFPVPLFGRKPAGGHGPEAFGNACFAAVRLPNGHTLITTGNGHGVIEVTPDKKIVWELHQDDLPGIKLAWVTTLQVLLSGNIILGNCHAGKDNPQIVEIARDKKVAWSFRDMEHFGDATSNSQVLDVPGPVIR